MTRPKRLAAPPRLATLAAVACLSACGVESLGDVDRTQANLLSKDLFAGQWYYRPVVVDVPYHVGFTFVGNTGGALQTPRIVWDVREDVLWAYQVHAGVVGADERWRTRRIRQPDGSWAEVYAGPPVAAFPILGHVDVVREYNPVTGEATNVVSENTTDRPWYARDHIRVDWARNSITDFLFLPTDELTGASAEIGFYPQEHQVDDPGAAEIGPERISVVQNVFAQPEGLGACDIYYGRAASCAPAHIKVRLEFLRVPHWREFERARAAEEARVAEGLLHEDQRITRSYDDFVAFYYYEPAVHDDFDQERFGYFRTERTRYDADRGATWDGRVLLRNRWNLWRRIRPANVVPTRLHPRAETLPYRARETRVIPYFVNADYPDYLWPEAVATADGWDRVLRDTVAWLRFHEEYPEARTAECEKAPGLTQDLVARCKRQVRERLWDALPDHFSRESDRVARLVRVYEWREGSAAFRQSLAKGDGWKRFVREMLGDDPDRPGWRFPVGDEGDDPARTILAIMDDDGRVERTVDGRKTAVDVLPDVEGVPPIFITCHTPARADDRDACHDPALEPDAVKKIGDLRWSFMYWIAEAQSRSPLGYGPSAADPVSGEIFNGTAYVYGAPMEEYGTYALDLVKVILGELDIATLTGGDNVASDVLSRKSPSDVYPPLNAGATPRPSGLPRPAQGTAAATEAARGADAARILGDLVAMARRPGGLPRLASATASAPGPDRLERLRGTWLEDRLLTDEVVTALTGGAVGPGDALPADLRESLSLAEWASPEAVAREQRRLSLLARHNILMADSLDDAVWGLAKEMSDRRPDFEEACRQEEPTVDGPALSRCADGRIRLELMRRWYRGVMEHEVGHTVGLRHNFEGSMDVPNFHDEWMHIQERHNGGPPDPLAPPAREALQEKVLEYRYSTVMDYGGKINSDIHGLGKYDRAAILYGYGDLVEVYANPAEVDPNASFLSRQFAGLLIHPYAVLSDMLGGIANNRRRVVVPALAVDDEALRLDDANRTLREVPYRFGSDEYRGNFGNYTWDAGVDAFEIADNAALHLRNYYLFDAFRRGRQGWGQSPQGYFDRVRTRHMQIFGDLGRYYALFTRILLQSSNAGSVEFFLNDPNQGGALFQGATLGLRVLAETLASPAPGSYVLDDGANTWRHVTDRFLDDADLTVPVGTGRYPLTTYDRDEGYFFFDRPLVIGSFWEKLAALLTLTDSTANFVGEYLEEDVGGGTSIGFNTYHMAELNDLLGSIVAGELERYAPVVIQGRVEARDFLRDPAAYRRNQLVEPSLNDFTMKLWSATLGLAGLPLGYDQSFIDSMYVAVRGEGGGYEPGEGQPTVEFTDPLSRKVYVALRPGFPDGRIPVAERLVTQGRALALAFEEAPAGAAKDDLLLRIRETTELLDQLRTLRDLYGHVGSFPTTGGN